MPDYSKCVIYTIKTGDRVYVGATCNFVNRKYSHKSSINNEASKEYNLKLYKTIRENEGVWDMQPHSQFPCKSKIEMTIEEERIRKKLNADLNTYSCFLTSEDKKNYHKEYSFAYKDHKREYRLNNKDKIAQYQKEYRLKNKNKQQEYMKEYQLNNKDKHREYMRQYQRAYRLKKKNELI